MSCYEIWEVPWKELCKVRQRALETFCMCPLASPFDLGVKWNSPHLAAFVANSLLPYRCR